MKPVNVPLQKEFIYLPRTIQRMIVSWSAQIEGVLHFKIHSETTATTPAATLSDAAAGRKRNFLPEMSDGQQIKQKSSTRGSHFHISYKINRIDTLHIINPLGYAYQKYTPLFIYRKFNNNNCYLLHTYVGGDPSTVTEMPLISSLCGGKWSREAEIDSDSPTIFYKLFT